MELVASHHHDISKKNWTQYSGIRLKCCLALYNLYKYFCEWPFYTMPLVFRKLASYLLAGMWRPCIMALAGADNQRCHHHTHPVAWTSPPPGPTAERQHCPGLAAGRPEATAPWLHRCGSAIGNGIGIILHLVLDLIQVLICVWWFVLLLAWIGSWFLGV
jgi:hypothetical protein